MIEDIENHAIRLLQEMRAEMRGLRGEVIQMRTDLTQRIDGNTLVIDPVAGVTHDHDQRISQLKGKLS